MVSYSRLLTTNFCRSSAAGDVHAEQGNGSSPVQIVEPIHPEIDPG